MPNADYRILGRDSTMRLTQDGALLAETSALSNIELRLVQTLLSEGFLGESAKRHREIFDEVDISWSVEPEGKEILQMQNAVYQRARTGQGNLQINLGLRLAFPSGFSARLTIPDLKFGANGDYGQAWLGSNEAGSGPYVLESNTEGSELRMRLKAALVDQQAVDLPQFTSCCPGWVKYVEQHHPDIIPNLSTCKSPQQMFGAVAKTYLAEKIGVDPKNMVSVSIMPCTAKKFECERPEMCDSGYPDVDYVLTTRELARMMKQAGISLLELDDEDFDDPLGESTGAATIFAATGGVMEAALRTVYEVVTKSTLPSLDLVACRGMEGVKEATVQVGDLPVKIAIAHGLANARLLMEKIKAGEADYHFIEIMCCPGGCIAGGGQPIPTDWDIRKLRAKAI